MNGIASVWRPLIEKTGIRGERIETMYAELEDGTLVRIVASVDEKKKPGSGKRLRSLKCDRR